MKKGQKTNFKKDVFQTGLTERCSTGEDALRSFMNASQARRQRLNIVRKKKKK